MNSGLVEDNSPQGEESKNISQQSHQQHHDQPNQSESETDTDSGSKFSDTDRLDDKFTAELIDLAAFSQLMSALTVSHSHQLNEKQATKVKELIQHQQIVLESIQHENEKFQLSDSVSTMDEMIAKCKQYHTKLLRIKKTMADVSSRTTAMKKQCTKLQELKAKTVVAKEEAKRKEIEREKLLTAQPVGTSKPEAGVYVVHK